MSPDGGLAGAKGVETRKNSGLVATRRSSACSRKPSASKLFCRALTQFSSGPSAGRPIGRPAEGPELNWVKALQKSFDADGFRLQALLRRVATSPEFFRVSTPFAPAKPPSGDMLGRAN